MANNYTPSYNQYLTQTAGYALPSSVRTYSVFDPSSNSWKRMTNDGRSPMPVQGQTPVADALALARQTQGRDWSAQPAQTPLGGPRMVPKPQIGGGMGVPASPAYGVPQRTPQSQIQVPVYDERIARQRAAFDDPMAGNEFLHEAPIGVPGYQGKRSYAATPADIGNVKQMFQESGPKFNQWGETYSPQQLRTRALLEHDLPKPSGTEVMAELFADAATAGTAGAIGGAIERGLIKNAAKRAFLNNPEAYYSASNANRGFMRDVFRAQRRMNMTEQEAALAKANKFGPAASEWVSPTTPSVGAGLSRGTANYTIPRAPRALDPMRKVTTYMPTPEAPVQIIRPSVNIPIPSTRLALPPGTGAIPMGRTSTIIRTPLEMTTPSGLARWQYRLDQLSGLGR